MNNNPFTGFGNVVEDDSRLIGREFQIEQLYSDIMSGANCSITGLRRIGKTSVAMALIRKLEKYHPEITCEFIDFSTLDNETSVYSEMMEVLGGESESCTSPEIAFKLLKRFLIERKRQYGRSVIVVDEFDAVTKSVFKAPDMVLNRFRSLLQQSKYGINMVIISRRNLLRIEKELARREDTDNISNLAQTFQRHIICPLGEPDSRKMIERSNKSWGDDAIREVYSLCGGHPYLTEELLYYVERNDCANEISQKDVLDALADCKVDFLSYFSTIRDFSKSSGCWDLFCERLVGLGSSNYDLLSENTLREYGVFKKTEQGWQAMSELLEDFAMKNMSSDVSLFRQIGEVERALRNVIKKRLEERFSVNWVERSQIEDKFYEALFPELEKTRQKENRFFQQSNVSDLLEYAYIGNLKDIVLHEWRMLQRAFGDKRSTFEDNMNTICRIRQPLAHNRREDLIPIEAQQAAFIACQQILKQIEDFNQVTLR